MVSNLQCEHMSQRPMCASHRWFKCSRVCHFGKSKRIQYLHVRSQTAPAKWTTLHPLKSHNNDLFRFSSSNHCSFSFRNNFLQIISIKETTGDGTSALAIRASYRCFETTGDGTSEGALSLSPFPLPLPKEDVAWCASEERRGEAWTWTFEGMHFTNGHQ